MVRQFLVRRVSLTRGSSNILGNIKRNGTMFAELSCKRNVYIRVMKKKGQPGNVPFTSVFTPCLRFAHMSAQLYCTEHTI